MDGWMDGSHVGQPLVPREVSVSVSHRAITTPHELRPFPHLLGPHLQNRYENPLTPQGSCKILVRPWMGKMPREV